MGEMKITSYKDGIYTTRQDFKMNGEDCYIINQGPFEVVEISKIRMKLRKLFKRPNPEGCKYYELKRGR